MTLLNIFVALAISDSTSFCHILYTVNPSVDHFPTIQDQKYIQWAQSFFVCDPSTSIVIERKISH